VNRLFQEAVDAIEASSARPSDKHVHVLLTTSSICRLLSGTIGILCKSGKLYI
jgi:hypothetical protein